MFQHAQPGDALTFRAGDHNAWQDAARAHRSANQPGRQNVFPADAMTSMRCEIYNATGEDLDAFSVLEITGTRYAAADNLESFKSQIYLTATKPTAIDVTKLAVTLEAGKSAKPILAAVLGLVQVDLQVEDSSHQWAIPIASDATKLKSASSGPVRIIGGPSSGTGFAVVALGAGTQSITAFYGSTPSSNTSVGATVTLTNASGDTISAKYDRLSTNALDNSSDVWAFKALGDDDWHIGIWSCDDEVST